MPTDVDHLAALVDRMSGHTTRAETGGSGGDARRDETAARLARAVGGESPARFLGRVVMERAAWLVAATDRTLHDVAEDSGTRYDVFARAFRREFGALPSHWRAEPTSFHVDAPNDVHFHPAGGLRLPARQRSDGADLVVEMVQHHVRAVGALVDRALLETAEVGRTVVGARARAALSELVRRMEVFVSLVHEPSSRETTDDRADPGRASGVCLRRRLDRVAPAYVDAVTLLSAAGRFDEAFVDAFAPDPAVRTLGAMVVHAVTDADGLRLAAGGQVDASR